jgi:hypothetical protein
MDRSGCRLHHPTTLSARPFNRSPPTKSGITSSTSSGSVAIQHPDRLKIPSKKNTIVGSRTPTSIFKPHHPAPSAGGLIAATCISSTVHQMRWRPMPRVSRNHLPLKYGYTGTSKVSVTTDSSLLSTAQDAVIFISLPAMPGHSSKNKWNRGSLLSPD